MSFFAVLRALLIEQFKRLPQDSWLHDAVHGWFDWTERNLDAGRQRHAWVVWGVTVLLPVALTLAAYLLLAHFSLLLALLFNVLMLYLTLGFRRFSHYFTDIRDALDRADEAQARQLLAQWCRLDASELPRTELLRHVIEHSLLAVHRNVFGVFFWFIVVSAFGLGPAGAVFYRLSEFASRWWSLRQRGAPGTGNERLAQLAQRLFTAIDHVPARLTAFGFAVVGNFEEAVSGWRRDASLWLHSNEGIILASAAGAIGVRLGGGPALTTQMDRGRAWAAGDPAAVQAHGMTPGLPAQAGHLHSLVGLVWRSMVLWMLLVALLTLANVVG